MSKVWHVLYSIGLVGILSPIEAYVFFIMSNEESANISSFVRIIKGARVFVKN